MDCKLTADAINNANALLEQLNAHIKAYLVKLQDVEGNIINADLDIASGFYRCYHYRPIALFHNCCMNDPYEKMEIEYTIEGYAEAGIMILYYKRRLLIPYEFSPKAFKLHCDELFAKAREDMAYCKKVKAEALAQENKDKLEDERIRGEHSSGEYVYHWENCTRCQMGYVYIGTGEMENDPFDRSESGGQREIMRQEYCPRCRGSLGLLIHAKQGRSEKTTPCSKMRFIDNENDFMALLSGD